MTQNQKPIGKKGIKKFAVCFKFNKKCLEGEVNTFSTRKEAKTYIKELHQKIGGFEDDHHIIKITMEPYKKMIASKGI